MKFEKAETQTLNNGHCIPGKLTYKKDRGVRQGLKARFWVSSLKGPQREFSQYLLKF